MKKMLTVLSAALLLAVFPAAAYADELETVTAIGTLQDAEAGTEMPDEGKSDADATAVAEDIGMITAIDAPDKTEYSFEYKLALESLNTKLPDTLTVHTDGGAKNLSVKWVCDQDYNEYLDEFTFIPDMEGYDLAGDVVLPRITVTFEKERPDFTTGHKYEPAQGYEIPFVTDSESMAKAETLPRKLNRFEEGALPVVRNQGQTNTCWAHATIGAMEADLIHDKKATTSIDLSEMHVAYYLFNAYKDPMKCRKDTVSNPKNQSYLDYGASENYASRLMSNHVGAVPETLVPLSEDPMSFKPDTSYVISRDTVQLTNTYFINSKDQNAVKTAIYEHGAATCGYYVFDRNKPEEVKYYNAEGNGYYCPKKMIPNHAVMIVGWDDDFSRTRFSDTPEGDGAWLIRNSWGLNDYGECGYFWLSYYDKSICADDCPIVAVDADTKLYKNCYAPDGYPFGIEEVGLFPQDILGVRYKVAAHEAVKAVGVEITSSNSEIKVTAKNLTTGQKVSGTCSASTAGIYTVELKKPLQVYDAATVEISVSGTAGNNDPLVIAAEPPGERMVYDAFLFKNAVDRGFYYNGKKYDDCDIRTKLYTDDSSATYKNATGVKLNKKTASVNGTDTIKLKATVKPKSATYKNVKWSSSNENVALVSDEGVIRGISAGTATITAKTYVTGKTAKCKVTVKAVKLKDLKLKKKATVKEGKTITLEPVFTPNNTTDWEVKWKSSKPKVAKVDKYGRVTGIKKGTATITVTSKDKKKSASCKVTVK